MADRSEATSETFEPFPEGADIPAAVAERLDRKQAMLLLFYNSAQKQTDDLREQVDSVVSDNKGLIDLITYDLGKYTSVDAEGNVKVKEEDLSADEKAQEAVRFAREIGVDQVPYIVIVDDQGYRIFWSRGFIDAELLERQVQRAAP
jgi:glutaredoxin